MRDAAKGDLHRPRVRHRFTQLRRAVLRRVGDDGAVGVDDRRDVARALRAPLGALRVDADIVPVPTSYVSDLLESKGGLSWAPQASQPAQTKAVFDEPVSTITDVFCGGVPTQRWT